MNDIFISLSRAFIFWMAWIIIPFIMEIIPAIASFLILLKKRYFKRYKEIVPAKIPVVTLIVPVYNSADTLFSCLKSVHDSTYPNECINVFLVNNQSKDNSFHIFQEFQKEYGHMSIQWMNTKQGKSKALNTALFNSTGKYIIHIDSDGKLHPDALMNMVLRFENNKDIHCMSGTIMVDQELVEKTENIFMKIFRKCEFIEYGQAFLAGRNFESEIDSIFTLSGAFSAFRKSAILKTQLYSTQTIGEDTHITFQVRQNLNKKIHLCENAIFCVDPIESINKMYVQRQRWQRGELEVTHLFMKDRMHIAKNFFTNFMVRLIVFDHTFAFPRMIWYFALICLVFMNYPMNLVVMSIGVIYFLYIISALLYFFNVLTYLHDYDDLRRYYNKQWYICFIMPLYNFIIFWIRFAGIINSINTDSAWKSRTLTDELNAFGSVIKKDFSFLTNIIRKIKKGINHE